MYQNVIDYITSMKNFIQTKIESFYFQTFSALPMMIKSPALNKKIFPHSTEAIAGQHTINK